MLAFIAIEKETYPSENQSVLNEDPHHFDALQLLAFLSATEQDFNQAQNFCQELEISARARFTDTITAAAKGLLGL